MSRVRYFIYGILSLFSTGCTSRPIQRWGNWGSATLERGPCSFLSVFLTQLICRLKLFSSLTYWVKERAGISVTTVFWGIAIMSRNGISPYFRHPITVISSICTFYSRFFMVFLDLFLLDVKQWVFTTNV